MARDVLDFSSERRRNSGSTIKARSEDVASPTQLSKPDPCPKKFVKASLSIHNDTVSRDAVLLAESCLVGLRLRQGDLVQIQQLFESTDIRDFETKADETRKNSTPNVKARRMPSNESFPTYLCTYKVASTEQSAKPPAFEVSINKQIALTFGFTSPAQVTLTVAELEEWTSSHVEICFRDAYLSRSDMWRFAAQELVGKPIFVGQKLSFINSLRATVRNVHIKGKHASLAYFGKTTVPVFRSEAARYVIFIQMSREMWDFDSEGNGEILFNKVVNGFLPELFKRWSNMEVRHLVSIVMFGRLEYRNTDTAQRLSAGLANRSFSTTDGHAVDHQDFYRVVVTDMASAQWTTILDELKRDFRVFLRDVSLFEAPNIRSSNLAADHQGKDATKITGQLSGALKGNVLEAINLAASQFSNDYIDRDLIRTGISTVVITAGSGVFDVDRDLLKLTSETLTNNGIGIDVVCLSRMPLHSVPLFRYRLGDRLESDSVEDFGHTVSPTPLSTTLPHPSLPDLSASPAFSSTNASLNYFSKFPAAFPARLPQIYGYGIPQWIDLSYWSSEMGYERPSHSHKKLNWGFRGSISDQPFVPRLRMYELQMMGLMEMGMADIAIPYLSERSSEADVSFAKWRSKMSDTQYSRSLSLSPELRRSPMMSMRTKKTPFPSQDAGAATNHTLASMEEYDNNVFTTTTSFTGEQRKGRKGGFRKGKKASYSRKDEVSTTKGSAPRSVQGASRKIEADRRSNAEDVAPNTVKSTRPPRAPRNFSYSSRGLMPFQTKARAVAAEVQVENVKAQKASNIQAGESSDENRPKSASRSVTKANSSKIESILRGDDDSPSRPSTANQSDEGSRPIRINPNNGRENQYEESLAKQLWQQRQHQRHQFDAETGRNEVNQLSDSDGRHSDPSFTGPSAPSSVPKSKIPYIKNVNASNPLKRSSDIGAFGRWQHLYPRKPRAARMKWRSLCTPASVPLTSEDFPLREELENDYDTVCHSVERSRSEQSPEGSQPDLFTIFLEMISLRIAHGYQFIVGKAVSKAVGDHLEDCYTLCETAAPEKPKLVVVLAMGNTIQKLELTKSIDVKVTKYVQKQEKAQSSPQLIIKYHPYVRTILARDYFPRQLVLRGFSEQYPWEAADNHLAGDSTMTETPTEFLRYWRARFVLIPIEPPARTWKEQQSNENDEEIHLQGIRALTQLWQKNRYVSPDEKKLIQSRMSSSKRIDENPLEVKMETLNVSQIVAQGLDRLTQNEDESLTASNQLLSEPQKLDRESNTAKIAQMVQGETGIEIMTRRWHWKTYHSCFHGEEFTNWLMRNVKNMSTREDAVEFGNQLMKEGLFQHVNGRHDFKDGHYFYSIRPQYRNPQIDVQKSRSLQSHYTEKSVPSTPMTEHISKELSPPNIRTTSGSNIAQQLQPSLDPSEKHAVYEKQPFTERKRKVVTLSRMIRVNVDTRNRSFLGRRELVDLHYDRYHNPENCYHIELDWLSTTCKLVDDAITSWSSTADRYGLKLVEVPIAEAFDIPIAEPFRNSYRIKLALEPPREKPPNITFNPLLFSAPPLTPHQSSNPPAVEKHIYQKAILKRSNFVLDLEAVNEFPETVEVRYSWGPLSYKYTQFIHRSGVILAQIMDNGDIILIANRLYNSRVVNTRDASRMFDSKKDSGPQSHRPAVPPTAAASMQASGIVGINLASPSTGYTSSPGFGAVSNLGSVASPRFRPMSSTTAATSNPSMETDKAIIADSFGPKSTFAATRLWNTLITPEQIKDDLEAFCTDKNRLEAFYKEVANASIPILNTSDEFGTINRKATGSSSSSLLRPFRDVPGASTNDITGIPAFELPEPLTAVRHLRRATVAYDSASEMLEQNRNGSRNGSVGSSGSVGGKEREGNGGNGASIGQPSPLRKNSKEP